MRIALARILVLEPDLLLMDEPTNLVELRIMYAIRSYYVPPPEIYEIVTTICFHVCEPRRNIKLHDVRVLNKFFSDK